MWSATWSRSSQEEDDGRLLCQPTVGAAPCPPLRELNNTRMPGSGPPPHAGPFWFAPSRAPTDGAVYSRCRRADDRCDVTHVEPRTRRSQRSVASVAASSRPTRWRRHQLGAPNPFGPSPGRPNRWHRRRSRRRSRPRRPRRRMSAHRAARRDTTKRSSVDDADVGWYFPLYPTPTRRSDGTTTTRWWPLTGRCRPR